MISRRQFVNFLSALPLVGNGLVKYEQQHIHFSVQESKELAWGYFASNLADALADLDEDEFLILTIKENFRYVQFAAQGKFGLRAEARSNAYEYCGNALSKQACAKLLDWGWKAPNQRPDNEDDKIRYPDGSPNYFLDVAAPVPYASVADLAVNTLRNVFGAQHPGVLEYKSFAKDGGDIRFPHLRIKRELMGYRQKTIQKVELHRGQSGLLL